MQEKEMFILLGLLTGQFVAMLEVVWYCLGAGEARTVHRTLQTMATALMTEILYQDRNGSNWKRLSKPQDLAANLLELAKEGASIESIKR